MITRTPMKYLAPLFVSLLYAGDAEAGFLDSLFHRDQPVQAAAPDLPVTELLAGNGGTYSHKADKIAFSRYDASIKGLPSLDGKTVTMGTFELWTINGDGSGERCLSCFDIAGGPLRSQHKGSPTWHPSGRWIVVAVEMKDKQATHDVTTPGRGLFTDLWAVSADGRQWYQLTHYAGTITAAQFPDVPAGALMPHFTHKGGKLAWAERIGNDAQHPFGVWRIAIADFTFGPKGAVLANKKTFEPGDPGTAFYAPWSFSPDDSQLLLTTDSGAASPYYPRVASWQVGSKALIPLTDSKNQFEDRAYYSPDGSLITYTSTEGQDPPYQARPGLIRKTFRTDVWVMRADGSNRTRVTFFNQSGHAQFLAGQHRALPTGWLDNRTLLLDMDLIEGGTYTWEANKIYRLQLP